MLWTQKEGRLFISPNLPMHQFAFFKMRFFFFISKRCLTVKGRFGILPLFWEGRLQERGTTTWNTYSASATHSAF